MEELQREPRWSFSLQYWKKSSPSRLDGMSFEEEVNLRAKGVQFITRMAGQLRLPAQTIFASSLFLHRFYTRFSLKKLHPYQTAAACVFLACKTEDSPRKLRDCACIATKAALKLTISRQQIDEQYKSDVDQWSKVIVGREDDLLQTLKFDFQTTAPYADLAKLVNKCAAPEDREKLLNKATMFINDSCRTMLSVETSIMELAVVALYWASKDTHTTLNTPENVHADKWYTSYLTRPQIVTFVNDMVDMLNIARNGVVDGYKYERIG